MNETQMFPPTPEERLAAVRTHLQEEVEKRDKTATAAMQKLYEARELLETFDMAMKAQVRHVAREPILKTVADQINAGALGPDVSASFSPGHSPSFTDEVAAELDAAGVEYERGEAAP